MKKSNNNIVLLILDGLDELPSRRVVPRCHIVATARHKAGKEVRKCCDTLLQIEGFTQKHVKGFVTKYFKERHDLAQLHLDMVECVLRRYRKIRDYQKRKKT
ncbi:unnamed protein product [Pocillopora meandrina]|uniref:NACHT domain-containing protein n=1 Tax=Pocillopora meandrina TaxID=46732 RepID=A0AAU9XKE9_9CNID|nr:unnamed protein product [Pocillopora meandrina]